ncbi:MAG: NAD(+) diphosphatase [Rhodocyclaceae bacterium]
MTEAFLPSFLAGHQASDDALLFTYVGDELILRANQALPGLTDLASLGAPASDNIIGTLAGCDCRALAWPKGTPLPEGLIVQGMRDALATQPVQIAAIVVRAKQMVTWDLRSRHCGACGTATFVVAGEPAKECPNCGLREYPRIAPAAMILIRRGDQLLLARSPHFKPGVYSALAGFVEAGESVETCIHREVLEEVGLTINNLRYFSSQSWPFPHSLMLAFHADYVSGNIVPQANEIEDAGWYDVDALPGLPAPISIASRLIADAVDEIRARRAAG